MKIQFIREAEGVYHYGNQVVRIMLGKNNEAKVKVGGGWLSLSEFIS